MKINYAQRISLLYMGAMALFWLILFFGHTTSSKLNYGYSFLMGILPFLGGLLAMIRARDWSSTQGFISKGVTFLGLGLFCWGCGELIWSYYNFFAHVSAPYPSFADLGFAPSVFFYCIGAVYLARAAGADLGLRRRFATLFMIVAPVVMFFISYYFLVTVARQGVLLSNTDSVLKNFFDVAYPLGDFISLTAAVIISGLSFKFIMKEYRVAILSILSGLFVMFVADSVFSYTTSISMYFNADFGDLIFTLALFLLTFGVLGFCTETNPPESTTKQSLFRTLWSA